MTATPAASKVGAESVVARSTNSRPPPRSHEMSPTAASRGAQSASCARVRRRGKPGDQPAPLMRRVRYGATYVLC